MIEIDESVLRELIYHKISVNEAESVYSDGIYTYQNVDEMEIMKKIFLKPFLSNTTTYEFTHGIDIDLNVLFKLAKDIQNGNDFVQVSKQIGQHLQMVSKHPNIKDGDLFVVKIDQISLNGDQFDGIGIFKIENKESFIETSTITSKQSGFSLKKGIGARKLDKACLILFTDAPYTIFVIDNAPIETDYWQNEFLKLTLKKDHINHTNQFLTLAKTFVTEKFPTEFEVTKADQIDFLNRSVEYFKSHDNFDKKEFEDEVFQDQGIIQSFRKFDSAYKIENNLEIEDDFSISAQAVKKQAKIFKSVLKLDKNFHIYIHGDRELIEQGQEKDGRKYYKIYFENES
ncbi:MAG TPA: nucleoid-associated protein [Chitinophagaceae bacterium]|nr:nucleoid-associated protein [Chitinophagaceae bacterium]